MDLGLQVKVAGRYGWQRRDREGCGREHGD